MTKYYVDSCIWLNLLDRERTIVQGLPVWKIAQEFLKQKQGNIVVSDFVVKETVNKMPQGWSTGTITDHADIILASKEEIALGREIESIERYGISFFDSVHIAIARTRKYILITRDRELLSRGNKYVAVLKPETLLY